MNLQLLSKINKFKYNKTDTSGNATGLTINGTIEPIYRPEWTVGTPTLNESAGTVTIPVTGTANKVEDKTYNGIGSENCVGYWLASPSADNVNGVMRVHCSGDIYQYTYYYGGSLSTRPVVSLKIGTTAEQDANGVWQLD